MTIVGVKEFAAVDDCPKCGDIAVHWLDSPRCPTPEEFAEYEQRQQDWESDPSEKLVAWSGQVVRTVGRYSPPVKPVDETGAEVVRVCRSCGQRWGCV